MSGRDEPRDPWALAAAGILGGLGAAVTAALAPAAILALPVGVAIAGTVYGVNVALARMASRRGRPALPAPDLRTANLPSPPRGSEAERWLRRAEGAVTTLRQQTESAVDPILREQIGDVDDQAAGAAADLRRFAGQVTLIEQAAARIDATRLRSDATTLRRGIKEAGDPHLREEQERALRAVDDQLDVVSRLENARATLLARMQSAALGLEGLVARLSELLALHATTEGGGSLTARRVGELTTDLEGLRAGLADAARISQDALRLPDRPA